MTISSVLVGQATGDQRPTQSTEGADPSAPKSALALPAGPWSAIDWEFGSLLQALIPDAKEKPVKPGADGEKAVSSQATGVPTAAAPTPGNSPKALAANLALAFQRTSTQDAVVPVSDPAPSAPTIATPVIDSKTVSETAAPAIPVPSTKAESQPKEVKINSSTLEKSAPQIVARLVPRTTSDVAPLLRPSAVPVKENVLVADIVGAAPVRTSDVVPTILPGPLPQNVRVESQPKDAESSANPAKDNTLEAEVVGTPAIRTFDVVPTLLPNSLPAAARVEPQSKDAKAAAVLVKTNIQVSVGATVIPASDIAPKLRPSVLPQSQPVDAQSNALKAELAVPAGPESVSVNQNPPETPVDVKATPRVAPPSAPPVKENIPAMQTVALPTPSSAPQVTLDLPVKETASDPVAVPATPIPAQTAPVQTPIEKAPVRAKVERSQQQSKPEIQPDSPKKTVSPVVESQPAPIQAPAIATKPIETADTKSDNSSPKVTAASEDQPQEDAAPPANPIVIVPVLQNAAPLPVLTRPIAPEKRSDDPPKSQPAGLTAIQESKPEPIPVAGNRDLPAPPTSKNTADPGQPFITESKSKADQPSPNDTEIAFTGRLVPRKAAEEAVSRPDSADAKLDKVATPPIREAQEAPAERQVRPLAEGELVRPVFRAEPTIVAPALHRDTVPPADNRPPEAPLSARNVNNEIIQEPVNREASGPVREISMRFNDQAQDSAHLRVVEKGGEVLVSVRSGSEQLARTLSSDLGDLAHRLEQNGFQADLYRPAAQSSNSNSGQDRRDNPTTADQNPNKSWARDAKDSQDHPGQKAREWMDDLEESMGLSQ